MDDDLQAYLLSIADEPEYADVLIEGYDGHTQFQRETVRILMFGYERPAQHIRIRKDEP